MERRDFFRKCGRTVLLGGILASAGYIAVTGRITAHSNCDQNNCGQCKYLKNCPTPNPERYRGIKGDQKSGTEFKPLLWGGGSERDKFLR